MASVEAALSKCLAYARDDRHGYELGWHSASAMGGGTDCSGLVRYYAALLAGVATDSFPDFSTRTERRVLTGRGWQAIAFSLSKARRGDVLLTEHNGHTVIYLGNSRILGAEGDWDGRAGDSSGREITERSYYQYGYDYIVRPPEGAGKVSIDKVTNGVYRLYNPNDGQHHLTASHSEAESLASIGWDYEGVAFKSGDGDPVYRLYNPFGGAHMLTASAEEGMSLAIAGWVVESVAFKAGDRSDVHRVYNPNNGDHLYTTSAEERDSLVRAGWADEGVAFKAN